MSKILLIEDHDLNRDMLSRRLQRRGYTVIEAEDGFVGLENIRRERPDIVLMDMSMPGLDGWEATRRLKSDPATADIPVIGLSAHAMSYDRQKGLEAGCDEYDTKPIDFNRLCAKIDQLVAGS